MTFLLEFAQNKRYIALKVPRLDVHADKRGIIIKPSLELNPNINRSILQLKLK